MEQAKVYGNVYSLHAGRQLLVVLNGYEAVRDALSNHPEVFSDRPDIPAISIMTKRKGKGAFRVEILRTCVKVRYQMVNVKGTHTSITRL